jgi:hypothetical protein
MEQIVGIRTHYFSHPWRPSGGSPVLYGEPSMEAGAFSAGNSANLRFLDVACSMPLGWSDERPRAPRAASLDEACASLWSSCFGRGPCFMPFSGGGESSMWLATATRYARRNGHGDPIPLTLRYPGLATAEELHVQERVVSHLALSDWVRVEPDADLDLVGPVARATLARTGLIWPANAFVMTPLVEAARDGVFVFITGLGDFFAWWRWGPLMSVLERRRRPGKRELSLLAAAVTPAYLRVAAARRRGVPPPMPWLRPAAEREAMALLRRRQAEVPRRYDRAVSAQVTHRCFHAAANSLGAIGEIVGTPVEQPLRRPGVVEAMAGAGGWRGFEGVKAMALAMCGDLLPADLLTARRGPDLTRVFFGEPSREFAAEWTGTGLDQSVIDTDALRRNWLSDRPDPRTASLLQHAWLTEQLELTAAADEIVLAQSN